MQKKDIENAVQKEFAFIKEIFDASIKHLSLMDKAFSTFRMSMETTTKKFQANNVQNQEEEIKNMIEKSVSKSLLMTNFVQGCPIKTFIDQISEAKATFEIDSQRILSELPQSLSLLYDDINQIQIPSSKIQPKEINEFQINLVELMENLNRPNGVLTKTRELLHDAITVSEVAVIIIKTNFQGAYSMLKNKFGGDNTAIGRIPDSEALKVIKEALASLEINSIIQSQLLTKMSPILSSNLAIFPNNKTPVDYFQLRSQLSQGSVSSQILQKDGKLERVEIIEASYSRDWIVKTKNQKRLYVHSDDIVFNL